MLSFSCKSADLNADGGSFWDTDWTGWTDYHRLFRRQKKREPFTIPALCLVQFFAHLTMTLSLRLEVIPVRKNSSKLGSSFT